MIFEKDQNLVQKSRGQNHILVIKKYDNKWFIENDIYEFGTKAAYSHDKNKSYDAEIADRLSKLQQSNTGNILLIL